jgi:hypothetical protein
MELLLPDITEELVFLGVEAPMAVPAVMALPQPQQVMVVVEAEQAGQIPPDSVVMVVLAQFLWSGKNEIRIDFP